MTPDTRARLSWLHRWGGLVSGWAIYTITLTGTLAVFDTELTRWMQPQSAGVPPGSVATPAALEQARLIMARDDADGLPPAFLRLPGPRDPTLRVQRFDGHSFTGPVLDPRDGHMIAAPRTEGGSFFFDLHYSLRVPRPWGQRLVAAFAFVFAIELLGGLLIHLARIIPDYFTLRLRAATPRFLLDAHVLTGTALLPFHIMITYTGLILAAGNALPVLGRAGETPPRPTPVGHWAPSTPLAPLLEQAHALTGHDPEHLRFSPGQVAVFAVRPGSLTMDRVSVAFDATTGHVLAPPDRAGGKKTATPKPETPQAGPDSPGTARPATAQRDAPEGDATGSHSARTDSAGPDSALSGAAVEGAGGSGTVMPRSGASDSAPPGSASPHSRRSGSTSSASTSSTTTSSGGAGAERAITGSAPRAGGSSADIPHAGGAHAGHVSAGGDRGRATTPASAKPDLAQQATVLAHGLHMGRTMEPTLRWLWFVGGLASTIMVASGLLFYTARRRASAASGPAVVFERLNAGVLTGLPCACLMYLYLNRLAPSAVSAWPDIEVGGFFATWLGCVLLTSIAAPRRGWRIVLATTALMGVATPLLDLASAADIRAEFSTAFGVFAGVDGFCVLAGLMAGILALYARHPGRASRTPQHPAPHHPGQKAAS